MALRRMVFAASAVIIAICAFALVSASLQEKKESPTVVEVEGGEIFRNHCAVCHGKDGRGRGPATIGLKDTPPDLTQIARRNGGVFPSSRMKAVIAGTERGSSAHGSREMPIWGPIFHNFEWDQDFGEVRLQNVTNYLVYTAEVNPRTDSSLRQSTHANAIALALAIHKIANWGPSGGPIGSRSFG